MTGRVVGYGAIVAVGIASFGWPFIVAAAPNSAPNGTTAHAGDAWIWMLVLGAAGVATLAFEFRAGAMRAIEVSLLGVVAAVIALLRIFDLPGGGNAMFFLLVLAAAAFGPRFATMLALVAMGASAVVTGGVGPWLSFQMLALAALGAFAGVVGGWSARLPRRAEVVALAAVAWGGAFVYGLLVNLWSWPLVQDGAALSYAPDLGVVETLTRYWSFYVSTSLVWDSAGAFFNAALILTLGAPILRVFRDAAPRLNPTVIWH